MSNSRGVPYFFNVETKASSWDAPPELTADEIKNLPGVEYLSQAKSQTSGNGVGKPGQVRASHLLVKHSGSRRPSSWKEVRASDSHTSTFHGLILSSSIIR